MSSVKSTMSTKRTAKRQQKKVSFAKKDEEISQEIPEVKAEVIVDNGYTESMKEQVKEENEQTTEKKTVEGGAVKAKKPVPIIFVKRNELSDFIVKESGFSGFRSPINKLISWIIENNDSIKSVANKSSTIDEKIKQLEEVKKYFIDHKEDCVKQIDIFKPVKKEKETIEPGRYFIIFKKDNQFTYSCVKHTAVKGNMRKHSDYELIKSQKVSDDFDIKDKKEQLKEIVIFHGRNSFVLKEGKDIKEIIEIIN